MKRVNLHCQQYKEDVLIVDKEDDLVILSIFSDYHRTISSVKLNSEQIEYLIELLSKELEVVN